MIEIKPIFGYKRGVLEKTPMDSVLWIEPGKRPREIGIVERVKGAPLIVTPGVDVSEAILAEARTKLAERDTDDIASDTIREMAKADAVTRPAHYASVIEVDPEDD